MNDMLGGNDLIAEKTKPKNFLDVVNERHSVRVYEEDVKIPRETLTEIISYTSKAPSSWDLQHWKFLIIDEKEQKERLYPITNNQEQVLHASAVIAVLGDNEADKNADKVYGEAVANGYMSEEVKNTLVGQIKGAYENIPYFGKHEAITNASLAAMQLMLTAKALDYDTCPMGGFDREKFSEAFQVPERYAPIMLISIGKRKEDAHATSRFPAEEIIQWNSF
jgi:nitroreductase